MLKPFASSFSFGILGLTLVSLVGVSGCTQKGATKGPDGAASSSANGGPRVVNLAIWSNYINQDMMNEFEKKTGIKVQMSNYSSNEELLAKLQAGASGYDVVVPSDYMVFAMTKLDLLKPLDYSKIPNSKSIDPRWLKKTYDPSNTYSVPYDWGTTGIAINRTLYKGQIKGWKDLFNNPDLAGKVTLLDDVRETLGAALKSLGYSLNSKNPDELAKAKEVLFKVRPRVKAFTSEPMMPLVNGETAVAHAYMSDALQARKQTAGKIEYIIPEEGATLWVDNLVIPTGVQHLDEAHALINFLLEAKSNAQTVQSVLVAPTNKETYALLPADLQKNTILFPQEKTLKNLEMLEDLGEALAQWDRVWTEVKAKAD
jgi:spermidine/putrescine transport system substrate-binding protein